MSYVLHLWEHPVPASVAEADQIHTRLSAERTGQNPKFVELAKRLTGRYPCMTALEEDDDGFEEVAWSDGPLDGETDSPVYSVGVQPAMLGKVVPFVAATAGALGLLVYDMQAAEVHLPGGRVLTLPGRKPVDFYQPVDPERLESKAQVAQILQETLRPLMESHGFKAIKKDGSFKRRTKEAEQHLYYNIVDYCPRYVIEFFFSVTPLFGGLLQEIAARSYSLDMEQAARQAGVARFGDQPHLNGRSEVAGVSGLMRWAGRLADFLAAAVIPIARQCGTIEALDKLVNASPPSAGPFKKLSSGAPLAYAAKNPRFDELAEEWVQSKPAGPARDKIQSLVDQIKAIDRS
jgi:hypothetical protein